MECLAERLSVYEWRLYHIVFTVLQLTQVEHLVSHKHEA